MIIVTGGTGLLGRKHAEAVWDAGGIVILLDNVRDALDDAVGELSQKLLIQL